jgi:hypothetical protein
MPTVCTTADQFAAALNAWQAAEVDGVVAEATKAYASAVYHYVTTLKTTWSPKQSGDIWTGQYRYSMTVSIGSVNTAALPAMGNQPWPTANSQYTDADVIAGSEVIASIQAYDVVYISNSAPHAQTVEDHNGVMAAAADLAAQDMASMDWRSLIDGNNIPF